MGRKGMKMPTVNVVQTPYAARPEGSDALLGFLSSMGGGGAQNDPSVFSGNYTIGAFAFPSSQNVDFYGCDEF